MERSLAQVELELNQKRSEVSHGILEGGREGGKRGGGRGREGGREGRREGEGKKNVITTVCIAPRIHLPW